ncbi:MAG: hypothetical protein MJ126_09840 [Lachnospiraceae bacterium]|nr:hypothetical protein [Lachnospiraceae bacterium]
MKKLVIGTIIATLIACLLEFILWFAVTHFVVWVVCALIGIPFLGIKRVLAIALVIMLFKAILKGDD